MAEVNRSLDNLYPPFRTKVETLLKMLDVAGIKVGVFETVRPVSRQIELYSQGRKQNPNGTWVVVDKKKIVTNSVPGTSWHTYGLAVDIVFDGDETKQGIQWSWGNKHPWKKMGTFGESIGLEWGGSWKSPVDPPHFQMKFGCTSVELSNVFFKNNQNLKAVWDYIDNKNKV